MRVVLTGTSRTRDQGREVVPARERWLRRVERWRRRPPAGTLRRVEARARRVHDRRRRVTADVADQRPAGLPNPGD
jgi:hypothetical protein